MKTLRTCNLHKSMVKLCSIREREKKIWKNVKY